jgi:hypothetical protein
LTIWRLSLQRRILCLIVVGAAVAAPILLASADVANTTARKHESFDKDPNWEGFNNRVVPKKKVIVQQDFGYSATDYAGQASGEMGGAIQRSTTPAYYAAKIAEIA